MARTPLIAGNWKMNLNHLEAIALVQALVGLIPGMRGVYAGRLRNAHQVEALTANLISINRRYKAHAGVRITDV